MTETEQRIAIAEFCGWTHHPHPTVLGSWINPADGRHDELPDYVGDLNAMHEAECQVAGNDAQEDEYILGIASIQAGRCLRSTDLLCAADYFRIAHATAAQRAEALLRTIGKWKAQP